MIDMQKIDFKKPAVLERLIGFTIPRAGKFAICDHDEVWSAFMDPTRLPEVAEIHPYKFVEGNNDFLGLVFEGLGENQPIKRVGSTEIAWAFDPKSDFVTVHVRAGLEVDKVEFHTFSGDWFAASLSDDGQHLVLAEPYDIAVYRIA